MTGKFTFESYAREKSGIGLRGKSSQQIRKTGEKNDLQDALRSPLPGTIVDIPVKVGLEVKEGDTLIVLEAMKMDNNLTAERDVKIKAILVNEGDAVKENTPLVTFE